jgi:hypothetical protein
MCGDTKSNSHAAELADCRNERSRRGRKPGMNQNWLCPFRHLQTCCLNRSALSQLSKEGTTCR